MISNLYSLIECVVGASFVIWGITVCINVKPVQKFIKFFVSSDNTIIIYGVASLVLPFGLAIIFAHNDWTYSASIIVTLVGWIVTIKCILWLIIPQYMNKIARHRLWQNAHVLRGIGALYFILGVSILYSYFIF